MLSKFESTGSSRSPINACGRKKCICHARILSLIEEFGAWENFSTAFIHDGLFRSANAEHFTAGHYELEDEDEGFEMEGNLTQYIEQRPLFGRNEVNADFVNALN